MDETKSSSAPAVIGGAIVALVVLVLLFFLFCFRVVGVGQVGIMTTLGNVTGQYPSGVVIKAPWPFQSLTKMNIKTQKEQQDAPAGTKDLQTVGAKVAVNYHLTPDTARKVFEKVGTDYANIVMAPIIVDGIKAVTARYTAEQLLTKRPEVGSVLEDLLKLKLGERGITVDNVSIVDMEFSKAFDKAIEQKQVAQQQAQKAQYDLQRAEQEAKAQDVQAKTLTPEYLQLQAIQKWDGHMPQYVGGGTVFNIPLGK